MEKRIYLFLVLLLVSCNNDDLMEFPDSLFGANVEIGIVENNLLTEVSGIVASRSMDGALWAHNDKGDGARIFLLHESGQHLGIFNLEGIAARDWEDIAIGPGPLPNQEYIYVADIGDNDEISKVLYIYRFPEPILQNLKFPIEQTISNVDVIEVVFTDKSRDAETMLIDPASRDILIVTKNTKSSKVYRAPYPQSLDKRNRLEYILDLPFSEAVGGDISLDGNEALIKSYDSIYYWTKSSGKSYANMLAQEPTILPYHREPQGEAIAWKVDGTGYYSLSEQVDAKPASIYFYRRR